MNRFLPVLDDPLDHDPVQNSHEEESLTGDHKWDIIEAKEHCSTNQSLEDEIGGDTQPKGSLIEVIAPSRSDSVPQELKTCILDLLNWSCHAGGEDRRLWVHVSYVDQIINNYSKTVIQ